MTEDRPTGDHRQEALAKLFYRTVEKILDRQDLDAFGRTDALYRLLVGLFMEVTQEEKLRFTTLFSRIAYVTQQYRFDRLLQFYLHAFRKQAGQVLRDRKLPENQQYLPALGAKVLIAAIQQLYGGMPPASLVQQLSPDWPIAARPPAVAGYFAELRVLALADDEIHTRLIIRDEEHPEETRYVLYDLAERNELFTPTITLIREVIGFPITLQLLEVEVDQAGNYLPRGIVVEPDYLVDVSAIAECFRDFGALPEMYLLKKFQPLPVNEAILLGNIANFFLDELMGPEPPPFQQLIRRVFPLNPLAFCLLEDRQIRELMQRAQKHYVQLQRVIRDDFPAQQINPENCYLEPTFYANRYGIQGRLDVFYRAGDRSAIVELKSGKLYKPNSYGIGANHFIQTLLYDLIIRSTFGKHIDPANYLLYSGVDERPLRFAPVVRAQQLEALQVRNQLLGLEWQLMQLGLDPKENAAEQGRAILRQLDPQRLGAAGYVQRDLEQFQRVIGNLSAIEQRYFWSFTGFIAREHKLAKTGVEGVESLNGQAALWLDDFATKQERFGILNHLVLAENRATSPDPVVRLTRSAETSELANFRVGDIAVLYPQEGAELTPLQNQLFKGTITALSAQEVVVRLRSRQFNDQLFREVTHWNLEHDLLDSGFMGMYQGLYAFAQFPEAQRALLLTQRPPAQPTEIDLPAPPPGLTAEQAVIFQQILLSQDYFLLWGPPGTGKTSVMVKHLVGYWLTQTQDQILLLAYTNRAVDELCEAIESFAPHVREQYLRIGSRYSTSEPYQDRLLSRQVEQLNTRRDLIDLIGRHRIIVATVASISNKPELFRLKRFQRVIIDEASQILEPNLIGLLPHFNHCLLIGDHKQLPAVVGQDVSSSATTDPELHRIGLTNLRNSFFERLYKRCQEEGWDWAYARLSHQGRMHRDIMAFPSTYFYEGQLRTLPANTQRVAGQEGALALQPIQAADWLENAMCRERLLFLNTPVDELSVTQKTNRHEALLVVDIIRRFQDLFAAQGRTFSANSLGVITPYRAQIAQIRQVLAAAGIDHEGITIDTVERYQGGARDIIVLSLCVNTLPQLRSLVSLSEDKVDRKLNVAITRAREHLIVLGNRELLSNDPIYREWISRYAIPDPETD